MQLENIVLDAVDPRRVGRFWAAALGGEVLTGEPDIVEARPEYSGTGPVAALPLDSADPDRDVELWSWLTGWTEVPGGARSLRHPSRRGPLLELCPEPAAKGAAKNRVHLDVRLDPGDDPDAVAGSIAERGGRELDPGWGGLPWRVFADASGNELCVLPARAVAP